MESGGRTTKAYGGGQRAEGDKFLLRFSTAGKMILIQFSVILSEIHSYNRQDRTDGKVAAFTSVNPTVPSSNSGQGSFLLPFIS